MDSGDVELAAELVMSEAGATGWDVLLPSILARRLFGPEGYEVVHGLGVHGELKLWKGGGKVRVSASLRAHERDFAAAHELAHFADHRLDFGLAGHELEETCNLVAAAILMPREPFLDALRELGEDWSELASLFGVSETAAALRVGELTGCALAVVTPHTCRVRGDMAWPEERIVRSWRNDPEPHVVATRLRDDPRRVVLRYREP